MSKHEDQQDWPPKGWYCTAEDGHEGPCPLQPRWWKQMEMLGRGVKV